MIVRCKRKIIRRDRDNLPHQQDYIDKTYNVWEHPACLMEMRLGKTLANIRLAVRKWFVRDTEMAGSVNRPFPCLIVSNVSVLEAWEKELKIEGERFITVQGKSFDKRTEAIVQEAFGKDGISFVLMTYGALLNTPGLAFMKWYFVVLDESPVIKNPKAKITQLCTKGFRDAEHRAILTGCVAPESLLDIYCQYEFLDGHFMGHRSYWAYRYACFEVKWNGWQPKRGMKETIKDYIHKRSFVLTRQQAGYSIKTVNEIRYVDMLSEQASMYRSAEDRFEVAINKGNDVVENLETDHLIVQRTWCARIAGGCDPKGNFRWSPKVKEIVSLLKGELSNQPVVIGFRFNDEIPPVAKALKEAGIQCMTVTGEDSREKRIEKFEWFRNSKISTRAILIQIKVAQYSVDLSVADTMILYSVLFSCKEMRQFMDRIVHHTKKSTLLYLYLAARDTTDEDTIEVVGDKILSSKQLSSIAMKKFLVRREKLSRKKRKLTNA